MDTRFLKARINCNSNWLSRLFILLVSSSEPFHLWNGWHPFFWRHLECLPGTFSVVSTCHCNIKILHWYYLLTGVLTVYCDCGTNAIGALDNKMSEDRNSICHGRGHAFSSARSFQRLFVAVTKQNQLLAIVTPIISENRCQ